MAKTFIRDLFVNTPKKLQIRFHTSSIEKYIQARIVFHQVGLTLLHFKESQEPYNEDYDLGKKYLLERAVAEIKNRLGANSLFFVEDTSVKIDALSTNDVIVPGLKVKEWFSQTSFEEINDILIQNGNNRKAIVYSDIALHIPGLNRLIFIHGETSGEIADSPPSFNKSVQYPWLTPDTFNGWFIPNGTKKRLGEMSFEESWEFDFRIKSLMALIDKLEEYAAILNLSGSSYLIKRQRMNNTGPKLFKEDIPLKVIIGRVCAGKTTLGEYAAYHHSYNFIEASKIMRMLAQDEKIVAPTPFYQARDLLIKKGPDIIAKQIIAVYGADLDNETIITGFRTIEEVQYIKSIFPECKVVFIEASERTRFERHLARGRIENVKTLHDFQEHDRQQWSFGLLQVANDISDIKIENESTMDHFHDQIDALLSGVLRNVTGISNIEPGKSSLKETRIFRCLRALSQFNEPALCSEIAVLTERQNTTSDSEHIERISTRHVNWVLKDIPELARRINIKGNNIRYEITAAGMAYLKALESINRS